MHPLRALSSVGSEHLPYKQRVGGSNPSAPTTETVKKPSTKVGGFFRFRHRAKFTSVRMVKMKKAKRCAAADGFDTVLVGYKGTREGFFRAERGKSPTSTFKNLLTLPP